jgi:hypothetical protein
MVNIDKSNEKMNDPMDNKEKSNEKKNDYRNQFLPLKKAKNYNKRFGVIDIETLVHEVIFLYPYALGVAYYKRNN